MTSYFKVKSVKQYAVRIGGNLLDPNMQRMVQVELMLDSEQINKIDFDKFKVENVTVKIIPEITQISTNDMQVGYYNGNHIINVRFYSGNTAKEKQAQYYYELTGTGVHYATAITNTLTATLPGNIYKTVLTDEGQIANKETITEGTPIDGFLAKSALTLLQFGSVAISIPENLGKIDINSATQGSGSGIILQNYLLNRKFTEEENDEEIIIPKKEQSKRKIKRQPNPNPNPEPEPEPSNDENSLNSDPNNPIPPVNSSYAGRIHTYTEGNVTKSELLYNRIFYILVEADLLCSSDNIVKTTGHSKK